MFACWDPPSNSVETISSNRGRYIFCKLEMQQLCSGMPCSWSDAISKLAVHQPSLNSSNNPRIPPTALSLKDDPPDWSATSQAMRLPANGRLRTETCWAKCRTHVFGATCEPEQCKALIGKEPITRTNLLEPDRCFECSVYRQHGTKTSKFQTRSDRHM